MNDKFKMQKIVESIAPFVISGVTIALFLGLLFILSYVVVWGVIIGGILWLVAMAKQYLFPPNPSIKIESIKKSHGRIIEHNDKK